jgi:hypothetical protein
MNAAQTTALGIFGDIGFGNHGHGEVSLNEDTFGDRQFALCHCLERLADGHLEEVVVTTQTRPIFWFASWCNKSCSVLAPACLSGYQFFLNFDVAILFNRAQHLLALARKVEQGGGLNG